MGDINSDGKIDETDVILLKEYLLGKVKTLPDSSLADIDNDGIISLYDFIVLKKLVMLTD